MSREPNQKGMEIDKYDPVMTLTDGVKDTVREEAAPLTFEELVHEQEVSVEAEYEIVVNDEVTVVAPDMRANVMDYEVAAQGLLIVNCIKQIDTLRLSLVYAAKVLGYVSVKVIVTAVELVDAEQVPVE